MLNRDSCNLEKVYSDYEVLWIAVVLFQSIPTLLQSSANVLYAGNIELEVCLSVRLCVCVTEGGGAIRGFPPRENRHLLSPSWVPAGLLGSLLTDSEESKTVCVPLTSVQWSHKNSCH